MKVTVYFRNVDADYNYNLLLEDPALSKKQKRAIAREAQVAEDIEVSSVQGIKKFVVEQLVCFPVGGATYALREHNIWVGDRTEDGQTRWIDPPQKGQDAAIRDGGVYNTLEVFEIAPCDGARTLSIPDVTPSYFCIPDYWNYTQMAPTYLATMKNDERKVDFFEIDESRKIKVHGISLDSEPYVSLFSDSNEPFDTSKPDEWNPFVTFLGKKGKFKIPLETYAALVDAVETDGEAEDLIDEEKKEDLKLGADLQKRRIPELGYLNTLVSHYPEDESPNARFLPRDSTSRNGVKQTTYFVYSMPKYTDVRRVGFFFVVDNVGQDGHCSLVLADEPRRLEPFDLPMQTFFGKMGWKPNEPGGYTKEEVESLMTPSEPNYPQYQNAIPQLVYSFPFLAAMFRLDFVAMKGRGELPDLKDEDDDDKVNVHAACRTAREQDSLPDVVDMYIDLLSKVDYSVDILSMSDRKALVDAMENMRSSGYLSLEIEDILADGIESIENWDLNHHESNMSLSSDAVTSMEETSEDDVQEIEKKTELLNIDDVDQSEDKRKAPYTRRIIPPSIVGVRQRPHHVPPGTPYERLPKLVRDTPSRADFTQKYSFESPQLKTPPGQLIGTTPTGKTWSDDSLIGFRTPSPCDSASPSREVFITPYSSDDSFWGYVDDSSRPKPFHIIRKKVLDGKINKKKRRSKSS